MEPKELTDGMLKKIMPHFPSTQRAQILPILNKVAIDYDITSELRVSAWLATLAQESGEFRYQEEIASGDAYDTRTDLGNTAARDGDGRLYKGRGRIQITGKTNYRLYTEYLRKKGHLPFIDFVKEPQKLKNEPYATDASGWYFAVHIPGNQLADNRQFKTIQIRVNGINRETGLPNHWNERRAYYERALAVLPDDLFIHVETQDQLPDDVHPDFEPNEFEPASAAASQTSGAPEAGATASLEIKDGAVKMEAGADPPPPEKVAVVKPPSRFEYIWHKIAGAVTGNGLLDGLSEKAAQVQALGLTQRFWSTLIYFSVAGCLIYLLVLVYRSWEDKRMTRALIAANTTEFNKVVTIDATQVEHYSGGGYKIVNQAA